MVIISFSIGRRRWWWRKVTMLRMLQDHLTWVTVTFRFYDSPFYFIGGGVRGEVFAIHLVSFHFTIICRTEVRTSTYYWANALIWLLFTLAETLNRISAPRHTCRTTWIIHTLAQNSIIDSRSWIDVLNGNVARTHWVWIWWIQFIGHRVNWSIFYRSDAMQSKGIDFVDKRQPEWMNGKWMARREHTMYLNRSTVTVTWIDELAYLRVDSARAPFVSITMDVCWEKVIERIDSKSFVVVNEAAQQANGGHYSFSHLWLTSKTVAKCYKQSR